MSGHNIIDAVVVAVYLIISFGLGLLAPRLLRTRHQDEDDYFLAGRKMPGWLNGISMGATYVNADVAPVYCGLAVVVGLSAPWFFLSRFGLGLLIAAMLFAVRWRQLGISTGPEFFALRFGGSGGRFIRTYSSLFGVFLGMVPWIGAGLLGVHMIFGPIFDIQSKATTLAIVLPLLLVYVWVSGFSGVLVTDAFQSLIIVGSNISILVAVMMKFGGPHGLIESIQSVHSATESAQILSTLPVPGHRVFGPLAVLAWLIVPTIGVGGGVLIEGQRIFSCKNNKEAAKMGIWAEITLFVMLLLLMLPAVGLLVEHPELYHAEPSGREQAYGMLMRDFLPVGLVGLAMAALLASVMSTISSHLNYGAQTLLNDVYRPLVGPMSERRGLWVGRLMTVLVMCSAVVVVYFADSLIGIAVLLTGLFGSAAAFGWAQWWWWRVNLRSWIAATIGGPIVYFSLGFLLKRWGWWQEQMAEGESAAQTMAMVQAVLSMLCTTVIWLSVTVVSKPEDMNILMNFYRRAHPMGAWGPVRRALEQQGETLPPVRRAMILRGFGASLLGFSWIALAVLACVDLFAGRWTYAAMLGGGAVVLGLVFKKVFHGYVGYLEETNTPGMQEAEPMQKKAALVSEPLTRES